jgi:hypothetical protein
LKVLIVEIFKRAQVLVNTSKYKGLASLFVDVGG